MFEALNHHKQHEGKSVPLGLNFKLMQYPQGAFRKGIRNAENAFQAGTDTPGQRADGIAT